MALGVILLIGTGGEEGWERHVEATVELANSMELGAGDLVYLIDAAEVGARGTLSQPRAREQTRIIREGLVEAKRKGAKVTPYTLEKQWN